MNALVVGAGRMGGFHRGVLRSIGVDVTTVDPDPLAGADNLQVPALPARWDVVVVASPIPTLAERAAALADRARTMLIEKPVATSSEEGRELARALKGRHVRVGYVERFNPRFIDLERQVRNKAIRHGIFRRWGISPYVQDPLLDYRSHDYDLARVMSVRIALFETRIGMPVVKRQIVLTGTGPTGRGTYVADLTAHTESPLHDMWADILNRGPRAATLTAALRVLEDIDRARLAESHAA